MLFRGTKDFKLEFGYTATSLTIKTIEGTLASTFTITDCSATPEETFAVDETFRFAKFNALSYHGSSAGLQYISFE